MNVNVSDDGVLNHEQHVTWMFQSKAKVTDPRDHQMGWQEKDPKVRPEKCWGRRVQVEHWAQVARDERTEVEKAEPPAMVEGSRSLRTAVNARDRREAGTRQERAKKQAGGYVNQLMREQKAG